VEFALPQWTGLAAESVLSDGVDTDLKCRTADAAALESCVLDVMSFFVTRGVLHKNRGLL
jgi:hypothetical protein